MTTFISDLHLLQPTAITKLNFFACSCNIKTNNCVNPDSPFLTTQKTIILKSWNILESSKTPSKYNISINYFIQKDGISHLREVQNSFE